MEDRDKSKAAKAEDIVDLTPDMELTDGSQVDIIDLTDIVDSPDEVPPPASAATEEPPESEQKAHQSRGGSSFSSAIEQEVEAAFDFVDSPIMETAPEEPPPDHEELMDKLSDIPQMVDDALDASGMSDDGKETAADEAAQPTDDRRLDSGSPGDSVAGTSESESESAQAEFALDEDDDEIIELTDIVDPSELQAAGPEADDDEEVIELTDIVDTSELEAAGLIMETDDDIIELTDIVDPSELRVGAVAAPQDEIGAGETAAAEAPADQAVDAGFEDQEYEDLLETIDALDTEDLLVDIMDETSPEPESTSEARDDQVTAADAAAPEPGATDEDQEYAELLETIDSLDPDDLLVSVDEAGLLETEDSGGEEAPDEEGLVTLDEVLNRDAAGREEKPLEEDAGKLTREVEAETGREVRSLTEKEIEAAVERILKSKYAETIERLIANAVEKAVNREIDNLKRTMLDDDEPA